MNTCRPPFRLLASLVLLASVSGCATQQALEEQTTPLQTRVTTLEQALAELDRRVVETQAETAALRARERILGQQLGDLREQQASRMQGMEQRLAQAETQAGAVRTDLEALAAQIESDRELLEETASTGEAVAAWVEEGGPVLDALQQRLAGLDATELTRRLDGIEQAVGQVEAGMRDLTATVAAGQDARAGADAAKDQAMAEVAAVQRGLDAFTDRVAELESLARAAANSDLATRFTALERRVEEMAAKASQEEIRLHGKVRSTVLLTEDRTLYPLNSPELGAADRAKLDALIAELGRLGREYHLDIQGHTDNLGTDDYNYALGRARAQVVARYLHEKGGIPLARMSVISYGATSPLPGAVRNHRRIAIRTLVLEKSEP